MNKIPGFLEDFLDIGESVITENILPNWLLEPFNAKCWKVKIPDKSRLVDGKWVGAPKLDWRLRVPEGYLTDPCWDTLLQHCKLLVLAHIEGPHAKASSPRGLRNFHNEVINLAEHLIVHYSKETELLGLGSLSIEKVERYLADHLRYGTAGTGYWYSRWMSYVSNLIKSPETQREVTQWRETQSSQMLQRIDNWHRNILTLDPPDIIPIPETEFNSRELQIIRSWLNMYDWYDDDGCINLKKIGRVIDVGSSRLSKSALLKYHLRTLEWCTDYKQKELPWSYREHMGHRYRTTAEKATENSSLADQSLTYTFMQNLRNYSAQVEGLENSLLIFVDLAKLPAKLRGGNGKRTPTLPLSTALYLYDHMIQWALQYSIPLMRYYMTVLDYVLSQQGHAQRYQKKIRKWRQ